VLCSHNCGLRVDVADGKIAEIRADESSPITHGYICNKGFAIQHYVEHAQRVEHPLKRRADGSFERISWEQAITEIAAKLSDIREQHSPRSIGLVGIGGQANHMDAPYGLTFLSALGSKRWFNAFAQEKTQHFLVGQWMFDAPPSVFFHPDIDDSHFLLMMGTNPKISNRGHNATDTFKAFAANPNQKLVVLDPRETETTRSADRHLKVKPGSDAYVLLGMAAAIVSSAPSASRPCARRSQRSTSTRWRGVLGSARPICCNWRASSPRPSLPRSCSTWRSSTICSRRSRRI
jgi:anaerobic selenocysteine-containing dehydrogenase